MLMNNGVMLQGFHWTTCEGGTLWSVLADRAAELVARGFTAVWMPPATKGAGGDRDVGYGVYDLWDLGEFDQKGSVATKYGTKEQFVACVAALRDAGLTAVSDVVLNHRLGADAQETFEMRAVPVGAGGGAAGDVFEGEAWTRFDFPGRGDTYSGFRWRHQHFVGVGQTEDGSEVLRAADVDFAGDTGSGEDGGADDYLLGADVNLHHPDVRDELTAWGRWYLDTTGVDGFRLDAVRHMSTDFLASFLEAMRTHRGDRPLFAVGECSAGNGAELVDFHTRVGGGMALFDMPLQHRLYELSMSGEGGDLSRVFEGSLVAADPAIAVTFVDSHDTQPGQSIGTWVEDWFKPHAYALILLRLEGLPVVFAGDYDGGETGIEGVAMPRRRDLIDRLLHLRERFNHGGQEDYFDHPSCVAWLRTGDDDHPGAMVVVMSNGEAGCKQVDTHRPGETFCNVLAEGRSDRLTTGDHGRADFTCPAGEVAVWVSDDHGDDRWGGEA